MTQGNVEMIPRQGELTSERVSPYGVEWRKTRRIIILFGKNLESSERISVPEDFQIGQAVNFLLVKILSEDRIAFFVKDLEKMREQASKEGRRQEFFARNLRLIQTAYGFSEDEFRRALEGYRLVELGITGVPPPVFREKYGEPGVIEARFYCFSQMEIRCRPSGEVVIQMDPVYDGGIDDIAYPLKKLQLITGPEEPIKIDFSDHFRFWRSNGLDKEILQHPQLVSELKIQFAKIVRMYAQDRETFIYQRRDIRGNDSTRLDIFLFDTLLPKYLESRLSKDIYRQFESALNYSLGRDVDAVIRLRVLDECLLSSGSYESERSPEGYYASKQALELGEVIKRAKECLGKLGCQITEKGIENLSEVIAHAVRDRKYGRRLNAAWDEVINLAREIIFPLDDDLESWEAIYQDDIYKSVFQKALEISRGLITITQKRADKSFFFTRSN